MTVTVSLEAALAPEPTWPTLQNEIFFIDGDEWIHASIPPVKTSSAHRPARKQIILRGSIPARTLWSQARIHALERSLNNAQRMHDNPVVDALANVIVRSAEKKRLQQTQEPDDQSLAERFQAHLERRRKTASAFWPGNEAGIPPSVWRSFFWRKVVYVRVHRSIVPGVPWAPLDQVPPQPAQGAAVALRTDGFWRLAQLGCYDACKSVWRLSKHRPWTPITD